MERFKNFILKFKGSHFVIICIISILTFVSITVSNIESQRQSILELNNSKSKNYVEISFTEGMDNKDLINAVEKIKSNKDIIVTHTYGLHFQPGVMSKGIYFNGDFKSAYKLLEGRFFQKSDFKKNDKIALVGKKILDKTKVINGERYIEKGQDKYKVIGVMGIKNRLTRYDNCVLYNLNCELNKDEIISSSNWIIDSLTKDETEILKITEDINSNYKKDIVNVKHKEPELNPLDNALKGSKFFVNNMLLIVGCIIIALVNAIFYWISNIKMEIGVRKTFGASNIQIALNIFYRYILISIFSIGIALIIQKVLINLNILSLAEYSLSYVNLIACIIFIAFVGIIIMYLAMFKVNRMNINEILKGN